MATTQTISIETQLVGLNRIAKLLGVSRPTATLWAAQRRFPTTVIEARTFAKVEDVLRYRDERAAAAKSTRRR